MYREDKKLKIDKIKEYFQKLLIDSHWKCKQGELLVTNIETLSGEVTFPPE